jgi:AAA15 family ATPase/GTPase
VGINGSADIEYLDDSSGTQQLFSLSSSISSTFQSQGTLVVDGLDAFLHPTLATEIVRLFEAPGQTQPVQLIFTALDPTFMQHDLLGRDQIWLADKDASGSTAISPLLDYLPREGEPLASGYLLGRYGGAPVLSGAFDNLSVRP